MPKKTILLILCLMILNSLSTKGICETKGKTIKLIYAPLYLSIASNSFVPGSKSINLYIENFSDMRDNVEKNVIGKAKTGTFDKGTPILIDGGVIGLTTKTLQEVFAKHGFNMVENENNADLIFKGRINKFWVQETLAGSTMGGGEQSEAEVVFDVALFDRVHIKPIWFDVKIGYIRSAVTHVDTTSRNEVVINEAFRKVITSIIYDEELRRVIRDFIRSKK